MTQSVRLAVLRFALQRLAPTKTELDKLQAIRLAPCDEGGAAVGWSRAVERGSGNEGGVGVGTRPRYLLVWL